MINDSMKLVGWFYAVNKMLFTCYSYLYFNFVHEKYCLVNKRNEFSMHAKKLKKVIAKFSHEQLFWFLMGLITVQRKIIVATEKNDFTATVFSESETFQGDIRG